MQTIKQCFALLLCAVLCTSISLAQSSQKEQEKNATVQDVQIIIGQEQIRFTSQKAVQEMQLQVFNQAGEQVFDSGVSYGPTIDWPLQNPDGQPLRSGLYAYTLSVKEQGAEAARVRKGHFIVDRAKDREGADKLWVTSQNETGIGTDLTVARGENVTIAGATAPRREGKGGISENITPARESEQTEVRAAINAPGTPGQIAKFISATSFGPSAIIETGGKVGIGISSPTSRLEIAAQDGLKINGYQPFLTLQDANANGRRGYIQSVDGDLVFIPHSFAGNSAGMVLKDTNKTGSRMEIYSQDALNLVGYQPFLTMTDSNAGWARTRIQSVNGGINFQTHNLTQSGGTAMFIQNGTQNVGIGTATPQTKLHVEGTGFVEVGIHSRNERAILALGNTIGPSRYVWTVESGVRGLPGVFGIYNRVVNRSGLEIDGNLTVSVRSLRIDNGADFSENFDINAANLPMTDAMAGMVVAIDPANPGKLALSHRAYDKRVAGIISGAGGVKPGMIMGQEGTLADGKHPVALTGRVYAWVDASYGTVKPGDLLTTSMTPGHAMKVKNGARAQGAILGKAMTELKEGKGLVLVLVTLQ